MALFSNIIIDEKFWGLKWYFATISCHEDATENKKILWNMNFLNMTKRLIYISYSLVQFHIFSCAFVKWYICVMIHLRNIICILETSCQWVPNVISETEPSVALYVAIVISIKRTPHFITRIIVPSMTRINLRIGLKHFNYIHSIWLLQTFHKLTFGSSITVRDRKSR